jgi:hypothetical protein
MLRKWFRVRRSPTDRGLSFRPQVLPLEGRCIPALHLTPAGTALGLTLTTFATGFPNPPQDPAIGPMGITFTHSHKVMVADRTGTLYVFPTDTDGQSVTDAGVIHHDYGYDNALGLASLDGFTKHFMDEEHDGKVVQVDDSGSIVGAPLDLGYNFSSLAADPLRDLLYSTTIFGQATSSRWTLTRAARQRSSTASRATASLFRPTGTNCSSPKTITA